MKASIQLLHIGETRICFFFNQNDLPAIDIEGTTYTSLLEVLLHFPQFAVPQQADKIAQLSNFLMRGLEFHFIENILKFQEDYAQRIDAGQFEVLQNIPCQNDYGTYDVSIMHPPRLNAHELIFFVWHDYTKIPYRASLSYPICDQNFIMKYELLPYA
ncbi:conserved hypothetical protein [Candidatus Protochlamydia naegleriophila]|uniref:Uncharacterized protein n=1 Tax=Candidatus Protochlamydia naegleriophila TaxID=389348 RepID=A0A0U5ESN5_9BACT|nr:hypothetical protein [Candidatus Protochlamydia naegleriophila]CUI17232.1 conserved hypothetical protein [Candidatus Protochlamydia naegleriophila]